MGKWWKVLKVVWSIVKVVKTVKGHKKVDEVIIAVDEIADKKKDIV